MPEDPHILTNVDEHGVMLVTINRPEVMNALSPQMTSMLVGAVAEASERDDVYALVLTGTGRGFCAGAEVGTGGGGGVDDAGPSRRQRLIAAADRGSSRWRSRSPTCRSSARSTGPR